MTWALIGLGWALAIIFFIGLACAAADGDRAANLLLTREEINCEQHDFETAVLLADDWAVPHSRRMA